MSEALFEKYVRGELSGAEQDELVRLLRTEAGARQFGDFIREWSLLADVSKRLAPNLPLAALQAPREPSASRADLQRLRLRRWRAGAVAAVAAGLLVGTLAALRGIDRTPPPTTPVATAPDSVAAGETREIRIVGDAEAAAAAKVSMDRHASATPPPTDPERLLTDGAVTAESGLPPAADVPPPETMAEQPVPAPAAPAPADDAPLVARTRPPSTARITAPTPAGAARLDAFQGTVSVLTPAGDGVPARPGQPLLPGQGIRTTGRDARAVLVFADATRLEIGADSVLRRLTDGRPVDAQAPASGKGAVLERGVLTAVVSAQPPDRPLIVLTPHAEARVQGTRLSLTVSPTATRLDVHQGRVRFTRQTDGSAVDLTANQHAATDRMGTALLRLREHAKGADVVRLLDDFEGPLRWYHAGWSAPLAYVASPELFHSPRLSLLASFQPRKEDPDDHATLIHPLRLRASDRFLRFHVRVAELAGRPEWSVSLREKDDDHWHLGSGAFEHLRAAKGWNILEVSLPDGSPDFARHGDGDGRFDAAAVESLSFSVGGGRVVFFLDTLYAVEDSGREVPFPAKPSRAGAQ
jgi:ferric-dicitrate binding protein FerR (iron transport regulator)